MTIIDTCFFGRIKYFRNKVSNCEISVASRNYFYNCFKLNFRVKLWNIKCMWMQIFAREVRLQHNVGGFVLIFDSLSPISHVFGMSDQFFFNVFSDLDIFVPFVSLKAFQLVFNGDFSSQMMIFIVLIPLFNSFFLFKSMLYNCEMIKKKVHLMCIQCFWLMDQVEGV